MRKGKCLFFLKTPLFLKVHHPTAGLSFFWQTALALLSMSAILSCAEPTTGLSPDPDNGGLVLPGGFGALVVADSIGKSRHLAVNENGDIYVKLTVIQGDRGNMAMRDEDNDGKMDVFKRFGDYPNDGSFATEMRIHNGYLYYSSELVVYRQKLTPGELIPNDIPEVILKDHHPMRWHNAKSLAFDGRGGMYVTFSAPTNACEDWSSVPEGSTSGVVGEEPCSQLESLGGIWKFDEATPAQTQADGQRFATGVRSVVAMTWNHSEDNLYAINHGRDYLHSHAPEYFSEWHNAVLPAEEFMCIKEGEDYGWPYTYYDHIQGKRMWAPEYGGDGKKEASEFALPIMGLPAHWAPNDLLFYQGNQFPPRYKQGAFVAFHGSTNRTPYPQAGYVVGFIPFRDGLPSGDMEIFADGFTGKDKLQKMSEAQFRPMGLAEGPDGSLYISESRQGRIWRILYMEDPMAFDASRLQKMKEVTARKSYVRTPDRDQDRLR
ncbi:MAG: PQQ-dependent sugar dehydrogenase [Saprospiraceae bacterium]|nr:PQQ-dependent sugar dehydrogenase [Saprospiraceae bacterium]